MSKLEQQFLLILKALKLPEPDEREYRFHPKRKFRFDFAYVDEMIAFEIDGGTWSSGRHVRGSGYENDVEKCNLAISMGWKVYRFTSSQLANGYATSFLESLFKKCSD